MKRLKRRSIIKINTDQAVRVTLEFVPGPHPYIWIGGDIRGGFDHLSGFIDDKDVPKLKRMAASLVKTK